MAYHLIQLEIALPEEEENSDVEYLELECGEYVECLAKTYKPVVEQKPKT